MDYIHVNTATLSLLFYFVFCLEAVDYTKFCVEYPNNTLCAYNENEPGELCADLVARNLTKFEKRDIILWHVQLWENVLVRKIPDSPDRIYWDSTLAEMARRWACQCNATEDLSRHFGNNTVTQHIFAVNGVDGGDYSVSDVLKMSEYSLVKRGTDGERKAGLIDGIKEWEAFRIGCGGSSYASRTNGSAPARKLHELVCNYLPMKKHATQRRNVEKHARVYDKHDGSIAKPDTYPEMPMPSNYQKGARGKALASLDKPLAQRGRPMARVYEEPRHEDDDDEDEDEDSNDDGAREELNRDSDYENIGGGHHDIYSEYDDDQHIDVDDLEREIERRIDEEFGPFKGFLVSTEEGNQSGGAVKMDLRINKIFQDFENAGAQVTSKGKFILWAIRDSKASTYAVPKIFVLFTSVLAMISVLC